MNWSINSPFWAEWVDMARGSYILPILRKFSSTFYPFLPKLIIFPTSNLSANQSFLWCWRETPFSILYKGYAWSPQRSNNSGAVLQFFRILIIHWYSLSCWNKLCWAGANKSSQSWDLYKWIKIEKVTDAWTNGPKGQGQYLLLWCHFCGVYIVALLVLFISSNQQVLVLPNCHLKSQTC